MGLWFVSAGRLCKFYSSVVVTSITPAYYAPGDRTLEFIVIGIGLDNIPDDAVFVGSNVNADPLSYRNTQDPRDYGTIVERNSTSITFIAQQSDVASTAWYLGAILSADRSEVFWVNNTRPLP